jgi:predicted TPR repeat methyltransferase
MAGRRATVQTVRMPAEPGDHMLAPALASSAPAPSSAAVPESAGPGPAAIRAATERLSVGDGPGAEAILAPLRAAFPADGDVLNLSGIAAHLLGRTEESLRLTAAAVATDPDSGLFHANHGAALAAAGRASEAAAALQRSLQLRPGHAPTRRNLGLALAQLGRGAQALPMLYRARDLAPDDAETHLALARCLREAGSRDAAAESARAALARDPPPALAEEARFLLADTEGTARPQQAPSGYVRLLFDAYAPVFDKHLREDLAYRTPEAVVEALADAGAAKDGAADILDLGCGTGLSGVAAKPFARSIVGIDLSPRMLEKAAATGVYDRLVEAELPGCLDDEADAAFDIVLAADVMIYLGAPEPVFRRLARILRPRGLCGLSFELLPRPASGPGLAMDVSDQLRFRHDPDALRAAASACGLATVLMRESTLRLERDSPVNGLLLVLRRD